MNTSAVQEQIRELNEQYLALHPALLFGKKEASSESHPTGQMALTGPSTLAELAEALRNPLPPAPAKPRCYSALEAMKSWKPLTLEMVRDLMAKESAAREVLMKEYTERTGQQVDYCEACNLGVQEHEVDDDRGTVVLPRPCGECDGIGVRIL